MLEDPYRIDHSVLFEDDSFAFEAPLWEQSLLSDRVEYSVGRLSSETIYGERDGKHYINDEFSTTAAIPLPAEGFGAYGAINASPRLSFSASIHDAQGDPDWWNTDFIEQGAYFSAFGIDYQPTLENAGRDNYKLTLWRREIGDSAEGSSGLALQYRKRYGEGVSWSPFLRLHYQQEDSLETSSLATAGLNIERLPGARENSIGLAYAQRQQDSVAEASHTFEMYYRMRLKPYLELTPDFQLTYQPTDHPALERIASSHVKLRLLF